jgi:hypothetical protein
MSAVNKTAARKYRPWADPNIPFALAILASLFTAYGSLYDKYTTGTWLFFLLLIVCLTLIRFMRTGWWNIPRTVVFICAAFLLGIGAMSLFVDMNGLIIDEYHRSPLALCILLIWLYLT